MFSFNGDCMTSKTALYSAVDDVLSHYEVDAVVATLEKKDSIRLPSKVQYAWPHPSHSFLYVSTSNGGPRVKSDQNYVMSLAVGPGGSLHVHGVAKPLPCRAVHMCVSPDGRFILNGHNFPTAGITVHRIEPDGTVGAEVEQRATLQYGTYPHQVMMFPSGRTALIVDRGNKAQRDTPEEPGALRTFKFEDGMLSPGHVVAPNGGYGFGPRHIAFHPSRPWLYVSDERTNRLYMFRHSNDRIEAEPAYTLETLAAPRDVRPRQIAGPIHVDSDGRFVFVANRADSTVESGGNKIFGGGENNIAVFAIDQATGEPTLVQHAETRSFHVRTFACDPYGRLLVTASIKAHAVLEEGRIKPVPAALSVFRMREQGGLEFVNKYDVETPGNCLQYWTGMVRLG
jgi:6-phosphogluconolactonase (cycloisomerase 2 family)